MTLETPIFQHIHEICPCWAQEEMNSYPTVQDEQNTVEQFLNRKAQEAMCCLDTQEPSDDPSTTPYEVPDAIISNPHDQTLDQIPHTYQASKHEYSTSISEISTNFTCHVAPPLQAKHEFLVNVGSPQVSFLMCTLEIPQNNAVQVLLLLTLFTFTFEPFLKL